MLERERGETQTCMLDVLVSNLNIPEGMVTLAFHHDVYAMMHCAPVHDMLIYVSLSQKHLQANWQNLRFVQRLHCKQLIADEIIFSYLSSSSITK